MPIFYTRINIVELPDQGIEIHVPPARPPF